MRDAIFDAPDLTAFCRLDGLGLEVVGQRVEPDRATLACRVVESDGWCRRCGAEGAVRDSVVRRLAHEPFGWRPTTLEVTLRRWRCDDCGHVWRQDTSAAAQPRAKISRGGLRWALVAIVCQHLTVARIAEALGVSWNCANTAVLDEGRRVLIADPGRFDGVRVLGVDEQSALVRRLLRRQLHSIARMSSERISNVRPADGRRRHDALPLAACRRSAASTGAPRRRTPWNATLS